VADFIRSASGVICYSVFGFQMKSSNSSSQLLESAELIKHTPAKRNPGRGSKSPKFSNILSFLFQSLKVPEFLLEPISTTSTTSAAATTAGGEDVVRCHENQTNAR
jgi:hypothetical protein